MSYYKLKNPKNFDEACLIYKMVDMHNNIILISPINLKNWNPNMLPVEAVHLTDITQITNLICVLRGEPEIIYHIVEQTTDTYKIVADENIPKFNSNVDLDGIIKIVEKKDVIILR